MGQARSCGVFMLARHRELGTLNLISYQEDPWKCQEEEVTDS